MLGREGLLERLSVPDLAVLLLGFLGAGKTAGGHRVPWDKMDLSDPDHPRLTCTADELKAMQPPPESARPHHQ